MKPERTRGEWLLRLAILCHPEPFRREYGDEMLEYYRQTLCEEGQRGWWWRTRFLARSAAAAVREGVRQRRHAAVVDVDIQERHVLTGFTTDLIQSWRRVRARPTASLLAAGMLALAIGVATAMFSLVDALLLRPAPFPDADRLAKIAMRTDRSVFGKVPTAVFRAWREEGPFEAVEGADESTTVLDTGSAIDTRESAYVTPGMFSLLGARPLQGRLFAAEEGRAGADDAIVISERLWRSTFGGAAVIGSRVRLDDLPVTIVGIMPAAFRFPAWNTDVWRPLQYDALPPRLADARPVAYARFAADRPEDATLQRATQLAQANAPEYKAARASRWPLAGLQTSSYLARATPVLAGAVVLVFLVLCANVSSLLLAQMTIRAREFGMCAALGASRARLIRQAMTESAVLGGVGILAGFATAWLLVSVTRVWMPDAVLLETLNPIDLDLRALAGASVSGIAAVLVAGLLPAFLGTRVGAGALLHEAGTRSATESRVARSFTGVLLVGEIALTTTLVAGTALLVTSFIRLAAVDRGLDTRGVVTAWLSIARPGVKIAPADAAAAATAVESTIGALPGVQQVVISQGAPPDGGWLHFGDDWMPDTPGGKTVSLTAQSFGVSRGFFDLFRIRLLAGRTFQPGEPDDAVIVSEHFAQAMWPGLSPIGRAFQFDQQRYHVVGLVREIRYPSLDPHDDVPEFYRAAGPAGSGLRVSLRCDPVCPSLAVLRQQLLATTPVTRIYSLGAMEDSYRQQLARPRAAAAMATLFTTIAIVAAGGGLFGVLAYAVGRRRREFGIRASLGARPAALQRLVLREGVRFAVMGTAIGGFGAWLLARALSSLTYEVSPAEPALWLTVIATIALATLVASWAPARRAARVDPVTLLREP